MQNLKWIRDTYKVPAFRGQKVVFISDKNIQKKGTIKSAKNGYLKIRFDGDKKTYPAFFHPTWNLKY